MIPVIHTATASFPAMPLLDAVKACASGISEPLLGTLSSAHMQLCPQSRGRITEAVCDELMARHPQTQFRLHANVHVLERGMVRWDASNFSADTQHYFQRLAEISKRLNAPAYTLHAGHQSNASLSQMIENLKRIQDIFGDIKVGVEGLYPSRSNPQLMDDWASYASVIESGAFFALDLSHLKILPKATSAEHIAQLSEWLTLDNCLECHLSDNNFLHDEHSLLDVEPYWWDAFQTTVINPTAVVFSEGNQLRAQRLKLVA